MEITDAQIHVWRGVEPGFEPQLPHPFDADALLPLMDGAGVRSAILVPPNWAADMNAVALEAARAHPQRFAVMGRVEMRRGDHGGNTFERWREEPGMLGLRMPFRVDAGGSWLTDGTAEWIWGEAEAAGIPVMVFAPGRVAELGGVARAHPGLRLVVDHMALAPDARGEAVARHVDRLVALAELPNVAVKVSTLPYYSAREHPFADMHEPVRRVIEAFGAARTFWGSDATRLPCPYEQAVTMMEGVLADLAPDERELVMGEGVRRWLGWR